MAAGTRPGYVIGRDGRGLTKREREMLALLMDGENPYQAARSLGVTKQRATQICQALEKKGVLRRKPDGSIEITIAVAPDPT